MFIATVIAAGRLDENALRRVGETLSAADCVPRDPVWIDAGDAADIAFTGDLAAARVALRAAEFGFDTVAQAATDRIKRMIVSDMDSTMIGQECIDELADFIDKGPEVAAITACAMRGEIDFAASLEQRVALLAGLPVARVAECLATRIHDTPGAKTLVSTMRARGAVAILVSGGFRRFAGPVAQRLGFDQVHCNVLVANRDQLTGEIERPILGASEKRVVLQIERDAMGLDAAQVIAVGDGANDLPMLAAAGLGVAYHAKPAVADAADAMIAHSDLHALLWLQGIARRDWVVA